MNAATDLVGAIDIGGTKVAIGLVTKDGRIVCRRSLRTQHLPNPKAALAGIKSNLEECLQESGGQLAGIGIGCTGPVDPLTGTIGKVANLPGWEGWRIVDEITALFSTSTRMENDADAAALAEATWGCGVGAERFLYVTISTGIGAGFLLQGKIYRGVDGSHPEMGHHVIDPSGPDCYCGARGCWESLASGTAITNWFLANDPGHRFSPDSFNAETIFQMYSAGDKVAEAAIARLSQYVGMGLANLTTILGPDMIAIGGGVALGSEVFLGRAVEILRKVCGEVPVEKTIVRAAALRNDVGLAGAAAVWLPGNRN